MPGVKSNPAYEEMQMSMDVLNAVPKELRENPTAEQQPASITKECDATTVVEYAVNQGSDDGSSSSPSDGSDGGVHLPVTEVVTVN